MTGVQTCALPISPEVEHATYESQKWFNGTTVTYTCDSGYTLADNSASNLTCTLLDGYHVAWDTAKVECIPGTVMSDLWYCLVLTVAFELSEHKLEFILEV